uniref:Uncharacterized protein n=1 Tax=Arundo donax TaxID=35708 RepID=A0A0A9AS12_ARUDO
MGSYCRTSSSYVSE